MADPGESDGRDHSLIVDRLPAGRWRVAPQSSEVNFRARTFFGLLPVNGFFERFSGELEVGQDGGASGSMVVEIGSLATGIDRRDEHLRSAEFFHVAQHPLMELTLVSLAGGGQDHLDLRGSLRIRTTTIPLSFPIQAIKHGDHIHLEGRVTIDHHAAGLGWTRPGLVGKRVRAGVALTLNPVS